MKGAVGGKKKLGIVLQKDTFEFYNEVVDYLKSRGVDITLSKAINTILRDVVRQSKLERFVDVFLNKICVSSTFSYIHERLNRRHGKCKSKAESSDLRNVRVALDKQVVDWLDRATDEIRSVLPTISRSIVVNSILDAIRYRHNKRLCGFLYSMLK